MAGKTKRIGRKKAQKSQKGKDNQIEAVAAECFLRNLFCVFCASLRQFLCFLFEFPDGYFQKAVDRVLFTRG